ncbi:hypothetical protein HPB48_013361 [Haemaphysalis longicornis]|uniref:Uncharacterized protein n=1 Tax=Haemaphysalis longicornis TaxID=44386 RepID=A0A9J6FU76_HAELO|nr:hypothetical protein HPB48_013361 [Haemaphysalis longicornis]
MREDLLAASILRTKLTLAGGQGPRLSSCTSSRGRPWAAPSYSDPFHSREMELLTEMGVAYARQVRNVRRITVADTGALRQFSSQGRKTVEEVEEGLFQIQRMHSHMVARANNLVYRRIERGAVPAALTSKAFQFACHPFKVAPSYNSRANPSLSVRKFVFTTVCIPRAFFDWPDDKERVCPRTAKSEALRSAMNLQDLMSSRLLLTLLTLDQIEELMLILMAREEEEDSGGSSESSEEQSSEPSQQRGWRPTMSINDILSNPLLMAIMTSRQISDLMYVRLLQTIRDDDSCSSTSSSESADPEREERQRRRLVRRRPLRDRRSIVAAIFVVCNGRTTNVPRHRLFRAAEKQTAQVRDREHDLIVRIVRIVNKRDAILAEHHVEQRRAANELRQMEKEYQKWRREWATVRQAPSATPNSAKKPASKTFAPFRSLKKRVARTVGKVASKKKGAKRPTAQTNAETCSAKL